MVRRRSLGWVGVGVGGGRVNNVEWLCVCGVVVVLGSGLFRGGCFLLGRMIYRL